MGVFGHALAQNSSELETSGNRSPAPLVAATAAELLVQLRAIRGWLSDAEFAQLLRDNERLVFRLLEPFGWHGSWVNDADYVREFDQVSENMEELSSLRMGPAGTPSSGPNASGQDRKYFAGAARANIGSRAAGGGPAPALAQQVTSPDFSNVSQALDLEPVGTGTRPSAGLPSNALEQRPSAPGIGTYREVAGDHVHQIASRTAAPGAKRTTATQYRDAMSISTRDSAYNDKAGQKVESKINRAAHGQTYEGKPAGPEGKVTVKSSGDADLGKARVAAPSQWFEDVKSFYKQIEAGKSPAEALNNVFASAKQLADAGATPQRVPQPPRTATRSAKAGQQLSGETPTVRSTDPAAPAEAIEPAGAGNSTAATVGQVWNVLSNIAVIGQTLEQLREGHPADAAKGAGMAIGVSWLLKKVPQLGPIGMMIGTIGGYDEEAKQTANAAGSWVERKTGNRVLGATAASGTAVVTSAYRGVIKPIGHGIAAAATVFAPTHQQFPSLGKDQSYFKQRIESRSHGCQNCHDAVMVTNWFNSDPRGQMWQEMNGRAIKGGFPTDAALRYFAEAAFPIDDEFRK